MQIVHLFEPSVTTLAITMLVPFLYFGYHGKYWYDIKKQKAGDFILFIIALSLMAIVLLKAVFLWQKEAGNEYIYFTLLHLSPLLLTLLLVHFKNPLKDYIAKEQEHGGQEQSKKITVKPLNKQIEHIGWDDLIISDEIKLELLTVIELLRDPKTSGKYGVKVPKGIILSGPPGNGKTTIAKVIANTAGLNFFSFSADEVISKWVGESEKNLSALFHAAEKYRPAIIFIDEIDTIGRMRSGDGQQWSENLLNHFLQLIDGVYKSEGVYIVGATNRPDLIDSALKRSGRLNKEIIIYPPDFNSRVKLFRLYLGKLHLAQDVNIEALAEFTDGLSAADISSICNQAGLNSFQRESLQGKREYLVMREDLEKALRGYIG